jgi:two-component system CheB/CheR fusion protein
MAIYELATNAAKYGALSTPSGRVEVRWKLEESSEARVVLTWIERDGPRPKETFTEGFGVNFVKSAVRFELQGSATVETNAAGVRWTIEFAANGNIQS